jgi:crossover junction endodeoxyribonuclease RuvC
MDGRMNRIGIDPGLTGAIASISPDGVTVEDMPAQPKLFGKGRQVDVYALTDLLDLIIGARADEPWTVILEQVAAMPKQGVSSMFSLGDSYGAVRGVVASKGLPLALVRPQAWKGRCGLLRSPKQASLTLARQTWPMLRGELARKKDVGRADALLIAKFGAE